MSLFHTKAGNLSPWAGEEPVQVTLKAEAEVGVEVAPPPACIIFKFVCCIFRFFCCRTPEPEPAPAPSAETGTVNTEMDTGNDGALALVMTLAMPPPLAVVAAWAAGEVLGASAGV
jgi:hypothetical protein